MSALLAPHAVTWRRRRGRRGRPGDAAGGHDRVRRAGLAGPRRRPARRHPADRPRTATRRSAPTRSPPGPRRPAGDHRRADRRRRGLPVPDRRAGGGGRDRAARPDRRALLMARGGRRAAAAGRRRLRDRAADVDAAPPRRAWERRRRADARVRPQDRGPDLPRGARRAGRRARPRGAPHAHARAPGGGTADDRRVDREMLEEVGPAPAERPRAFVCGPTGFVEVVADSLVEIGHDPGAIHAERFGPTG